MSVTEEQYELIIKYIDQQLNEQEEILFNSYQQNSEEFRAELEQIEALTAGLKAVEKAEEIERIKKIFEEFDTEVASQPNRSVFQSSYIKYGIAASIALIALVAYLLIWDIQSNNPAELYQTYYEVFPADAEKRSGKSTVEAMRYYENGQYKEAIPLLIEQKNNTSSSMLPVFLANAYLQTNQPKNAIFLLKEFVTDTENSYSQQFYRWYLGLAYLKSNNIKEASDVFSQLAEKKGIYQKQSIEILEKLE